MPASRSWTHLMCIVHSLNSRWNVVEKRWSLANVYVPTVKICKSRCLIQDTCNENKEIHNILVLIMRQITAIIKLNDKYLNRKSCVMIWIDKFSLVFGAILNDDIHNYDIISHIFVHIIRIMNHHIINNIIKIKLCIQHT